VRLRCSVAHAFQTFTDRVDVWWPPGHRRYQGSRLVLEAQVGGRFYERAPTGEEMELGQVLACEPPHSISYSWRPGALAQPTRVDLRFEPEGAETVVHVLHSEGGSQLGPAWPERARLFERGWQHVLTALAGHVAGAGAAREVAREEGSDEPEL
jgi:uncharacterized protein YndB with AHSA1/START domain